MFVYFDGGRRGDVILSGTRGDQKVLQLGYKMFKNFISYMLSFLTYSHGTAMHIFIFCS